MHGFDAAPGIDRTATLALLNKVSHVKLGMMRAILVGSVRLQKRLFEASLVDTNLSVLWHR